MNARSATMKGIARSIRAAVLLALGFTCSNVALAGPIHDAARKGDQAKVVALLSQNPDLVSSRDKFGNTPLHLAALHDQPAIAALLLANGADVNAQSIVRQADSDGITRSGETPLTLALLSYQHKEMVELLLTHGADPNVMLAFGVTPLHRAVERNLPYDVELLLANGADPNRKGFNWRTPVHLAVMHGRTEILKILLDYGGDPNAKDQGGRTPMFYAQWNFDEKVIALLRAHGGHS
jgi:ankyrin repeat protein